MASSWIFVLLSDIRLPLPPLETTWALPSPGKINAFEQCLIPVPGLCLCQVEPGMGAV